MQALYLHIPFCRSKCHYCSFSSCAGGGEFYAPYVKALEMELCRTARLRSRLPLESLFIGGGTPSILPCSLLTGIIGKCLEFFTTSASTEISVEANPGTVDESYLRALYLVGVNRLSLGVQSFNDRELASLGRVHSAEDAYRAVETAKNVGFSNINLDLMCGLPGQTAQSWGKTLDRALALRPEHLSVYQLTVEQGTPFSDLMEGRKIELPDEEEISRIDLKTSEATCTAGMNHYEISNFCLPGYECRHNINYWMNGEYFACGSSAVSYYKGIREKRTSNLGEYIGRMEAALPVVVERDCLSLEASFRETVIMGLRLTCGVDRDLLLQRYDRDVEHYYGPILKKLLNFRLLELTSTHLRLTPKGRLLANQVMVELV